MKQSISRSFLLFLFILIPFLHCGTTTLKFAGSVYDRDSIGCSKGTEYLDTFTFFAALLGFLVDLSIGGFIYFIFRLLGKPENHGYFIAFLILYGLLSFVVSTQVVWLSDRSVNCVFDFRIKDMRIKAYPAISPLSEINRKDNQYRIPEKCDSERGRLAGLKDEELLRMISNRKKSPETILIFDDTRKRFSAFRFNGGKQWPADADNGKKSAYCILP